MAARTLVSVKHHRQHSKGRSPVSLWFLRILEVVGQTILGDGITCLIVPRRHMLLWRDALQRPGWRNVFQWFADRPRVTFMTGLVECLIGLGMIWRSSRDS